MIAFVPGPIMRRNSLGGDMRMDTSARAQDSRPLSISRISKDLIITGDVTSKGELHVDGQIQGDVRCVALVLGENAQLEGNVVAEDVKVRGRLIGSVHALRVVLQSTAQVEGNLVHRVFPLSRARISTASRIRRRIRFRPARKHLR